jgi:hypothetical protein
MPPPGLYGGTIQGTASTFEFLDGNGKPVPELRDAFLTKQVAEPLLYYVPDIKVLGGSIGFGGVIPFANQCGHFFIGDADRCTLGVGDPYVEIDWARAFGVLRASRYPNAYPIFEGLSVLVGFGAVIPVGKYDASDLTEQALSTGNNIWDLAPSVAFTYTTPPILAEGTEFSAKLYWNIYLENSRTNYLTGDLLNLDFALSEHIGRFQVGVVGTYVWQVDDDRLLGVPVAPDGRRIEILQLGGVLGYDMPEHAASLKLKANTTAYAENTVTFWSVVMGWYKKF